MRRSHRTHLEGREFSNDVWGTINSIVYVGGGTNPPFPDHWLVQCRVGCLRPRPRTCALRPPCRQLLRGVCVRVRQSVTRPRSPSNAGKPILFAFLRRRQMAMLCYLCRGEGLSPRRHNGNPPVTSGSCLCLLPCDCTAPRPVHEQRVKLSLYGWIGRCAVDCSDCAAAQVPCGGCPGCHLELL